MGCVLLSVRSRACAKLDLTLHGIQLSSDMPYYTAWPVDYSGDDQPLTPCMSLQERLRQQIEEIKEQEANYDADAALAMAMFEHSEVSLPC